MFENKKIKIIAGIIGIILLGILFYRVLFQQDISSLILNKQYIKLYEQGQFQLEVTSGATLVDSSKLIWTSENTNVASVTSNGLVIGNMEGQTRIIVKTKDGKVSNTCIVEVAKNEIESLELNRREIILNPGETNEFKLIIMPDDLIIDGITWESSDPNIVKVDEEGKIQALSSGIATIKAKVLGQETSAIVYVGIKATSLQMENAEEEIEITKSLQLKATITPENAINEKILWESSDTDVVTVDDNGLISGIGIGVALITAKTEYSNVKVSCSVTVSKKSYEVKYMELDKTVFVKDGEPLGTLPTMTKTGYKLSGWYTSASGGNKVSAATVVTTNMTLYPHWEISYCLPKDSRFNSYETTVSSDTETLKYRIIRYSNHDVVLVWVADATKQLKLGLAVSNAKGRLPAEYILKQVPAGKALVAVNGSLFDESTGSPNYGVIIKDGKVIKDENGKGGCVGLNRDSTLVNCTGKTSTEMLKMGILNNFSISHGIIGGKSDGTKSAAHKTQFCQADKNNFLIISAYNTTNSTAAQILYNLSGRKCKMIYNLDGGGSRKLYYRTKKGSLVKKFGGDRLIPDMLYFTEQ